MQSASPRVWTAGVNLLPALAKQVLDGFPLRVAVSSRPPLSAWTILVPTRRAGRRLERLLFDQSGADGLVLPRIQPIGDIDEDEIADSAPTEGVPDAISKTGLLFLILSLVDSWAHENPQLSLAHDIANSGTQALRLAQSLRELVDLTETEEIDFRIVENIYQLDLAGHRAAILSLLDLLQTRLPQMLAAGNVIGPAARRNRMIRLEAHRIASGGHKGPIIAAGSTGTNPATRALLKAIANHPEGAVIVPGLDIAMDEDSWNAVAADHPQFSLKVLLGELAITRGDVECLTDDRKPRQWLVREALRPAATTDKWQSALQSAPTPAAELARGLQLIEASDRHQEARCIALLMRECLETPDARAALITPDRDLAQRVTAELGRWRVEADDSAGTPLSRTRQAQLLTLLLSAAADHFSPVTLSALFCHPDCDLGMAHGIFERLAHVFEITCLRGELPFPRLAELAEHVKRVGGRLTGVENHAHPAIKRITPDDWSALMDFVRRLVSALSPLADRGTRTLADHVTLLMDCLDAFAPYRDRTSAAARLLEEVIEGLKLESDYHPPCTLARAGESIVHVFDSSTVRPPLRHDARLAIYGLPEARLMQADLVILGGLNEGIWPALADAGPWLNRSMRAELGLQPPERSIGVTALDFTQALGHGRVAVTWSKRIAGEPQVASRWILRLRAVLQSIGVSDEKQLDSAMPQLARTIDAPENFAPRSRPLPRPAVALRPLRFSVTEIETLLRDPYAIYARRMLELQPLPALGAEPGAALRGNLFHLAIAMWSKARSANEPQGDLIALLAMGQDVFQPFIDRPDVRHFWWPRFRRIAEALVAFEKSQAMATVRSLIEQRGAISFTVAGVLHRLVARADRIDVDSNGMVRLIDYKSGEVPTVDQVKSGLSPQLTLEAAMVARGGFGAELPGHVSELVYVKIGGGDPPLEITNLAEKLDVATTADTHFARLCALLALYQDAMRPYRPRAAAFKEDSPSDYDHLSRHGEWLLAGET